VSSAQSPTFPRFQLGKQLRMLREQAKLTTEDVGLQLDCSPSTISRMEGGKVGIRRVGAPSNGCWTFTSLTIKSTGRH
jgi:hypothetical protein